MAPLPAAFLRRPTLPTVRSLTRATVVALTAIVATGGAVRLTRSGLGCDSWPTCGRQDGWHAIIEFGNRLAGGAVGLLIVATLVAVCRLAPRRRDLRRPAWGLVAGFFAQAGLGALSVTLKLPPGVVVAHFLLSMVLVAVAAVLHARTRPADTVLTDFPAPPSLRPRPELSWLAWALIVAVAAILVLGTLVTGTGPHSGADPRQPAPRFTFLPLHVISMVHGNAAFLVVGLALANLLVVRMTDTSRALRRPAELIVAAVVLQAVIGIAQYALGLPRGLVGIHMVGATVLWLAVLGNHLAVRRASHSPTPAEPRRVDVPAGA